MNLSTETSTTSLKRKDRKGNRKKERKWERENEMKRGKRDFTNEDLALPNHLRLLMNLWKALISALDTEFIHDVKLQVN